MINRIILTSGYQPEDDELTEMKGHRSDVLVESNTGELFELNFISLSRLSVELKYNKEKGVDCFTDRGLIVVEVVNMDTIKRAVLGLNQMNFFQTQKPIQISHAKDWFFIEIG